MSRMISGIWSSDSYLTYRMDSSCSSSTSLDIPATGALSAAAWSTPARCGPGPDSAPSISATAAARAWSPEPVLLLTSFSSRQELLSVIAMLSVQFIPLFGGDWLCDISLTLHRLFLVKLLFSVWSLCVSPMPSKRWSDAAFWLSDGRWCWTWFWRWVWLHWTPFIWAVWNWAADALGCTLFWLDLTIALWSLACWCPGPGLMMSRPSSVPSKVHPSTGSGVIALGDEGSALGPVGTSAIPLHTVTMMTEKRGRNQPLTANDDKQTCVRLLVPDKCKNNVKFVDYLVSVPAITQFTPHWPIICRKAERMIYDTMSARYKGSWEIEFLIYR